MSASLVGSEMCIRDSRLAPPSRHFGPVASLPCCSGVSSGAARRCWSPVSYTHLTLPTICSV
eukprot:13340064-Alexandrium_andersonii.AAC.1